MNSPSLGDNLGSVELVLVFYTVDCSACADSVAIVSICTKSVHVLIGRELSAVCPSENTVKTAGIVCKRVSNSIVGY